LRCQYNITGVGLCSTTSVLVYVGGDHVDLGEEDYDEDEEGGQSILLAVEDASESGVLLGVKYSRVAVF
jgi:hypothetical protein